MPAHLTPLSEPTLDAVTTGDPRRAFGLAQALMVQPKMSHQARGLWGYTGKTEAGLELTVQSTGAGGPGAISVIGDLAGLGVKRLVRIGTCVAPAGFHEPGNVLLVERAIAMDGASRGLITGKGPAGPDSALFELLDGVARPATISSHDFVARFDPEGPLPAAGATARDLQTAATLAFSREVGLEAAALLVVAGNGEGSDLGEADLEETFFGIGRRVVERLVRTRP
jgi:purine-nucleoside phosphorylase